MTFDRLWQGRYLPVAVCALAGPVAAIGHKGTVLLLMIGALAAAPMIWSAWRAGATLPKLPIWIILVLLFIFWSFVTSFWSIDYQTSLFKSLQFFYIFIMGLVFLFLIKNIDIELKAKILKYIALSCILTFFIIIFQFFFIHFFGTFKTYPPGFNTISILNPGITVLTILIWLALASFSMKSSWMLSALVIGICILLINFTASGAGSAALVIGLIGFVSAVAWPRVTAGVTAIALCMALLSAPFVVHRLTGNPHVMEAARTLPDSVRHRVYIWRFAAEKIIDRPILGWGMGVSPSIPGGGERPPVGNAYMPLHPHNAALQIWLELGAPGALLVAAVIAFISMRIAAARSNRLYAGAAIGSLVSYASVAFTSYSIFQSWWISVVWLLLPMLVAAKSATAAESAPKFANIGDGRVSR